MRLRLAYLLVAIVCIAIGLGFRAPALGLPREVAKYGGSILWAAMVYFGLRVVGSQQRIVVLAAISAVLAALGEATQLISFRGFDELRETAIGHLVFGRTFAFEDIIAYWIGISLAALGDGLIRPCPK